MWVKMGAVVQFGSLFVDRSTISPGIGGSGSERDSRAQGGKPESELSNSHEVCCFLI